MAAVGLRKEGHSVTVSYSESIFAMSTRLISFQLFERSELAQEVGAALHLAPNAHGLLRRYGIFPEEFGANPAHGVGHLRRTQEPHFRSNDGLDDGV